MKQTMKKVLITATIAGLVAGCSDVNRSSAPVVLVLSQTQILSRFDISPSAANCDQNFSTVDVKAVLLTNPNNTNLPVDARFNDVKLTSYRVSYSRHDGGTLVPAPYTQATSGLVLAGGAGTPLSKFIVLKTEALSMAPFAALLPSGGGRDPETGLKTVTMDIILEVFGETVSGERVSGNTRMTMVFCFSCGGCA